MKLHLPVRLLAALAAAWSLSATAVMGADVVKNETVASLGDGSAWAGGTAPGSGDVAVWNASSALGTAEAPLDLGADATWSGIKLSADTPQNVFIGSASVPFDTTLSLGAQGIFFQQLRSALTIGGNLNLVANQTWQANAGWVQSNVTVRGNLTGTGNLSFRRGGGMTVLVEGNASGYTGTLTMEEWNFVTFASGLTNGDIKANAGGGQSQITVRDGADFVYNHALTMDWTPNGGGAVNVFSLLNGTLTLAGTNSLNGSIKLENDALLRFQSGEGTVKTTITKALSVTGSGTIELVGTHSLNASAGSLTVGSGVTLDITRGGLALSGYSNRSDVLIIQGTLKLSSYDYNGSISLLADYARCRKLDGGTLIVDGTSHDSILGITITEKGGTFLMQQAGETLTLKGNMNSPTIQMNGTGGELLLGGAGNIIINGNAAQSAISGSGTIIKTGSGTLTLNHGSTAFSGNFIMREGTLVLGHDEAVRFLNYEGGTLDLGNLALAGLTISFGDGVTVDSVLNGGSFKGTVYLGDAGDYELAGTPTFGAGYLVGADTVITLTGAIDFAESGGGCFLNGDGHELTLTGDGYGLSLDGFNGEAGAINGASVTFETIGDIVISNNTATSGLYVAGGAVTATGTITFSGTGAITMNGNRAANGRTTIDGTERDALTGLGGALSAEEGISFDTTGNLEFAGNVADLSGGAMYDGSGEISMTGIGDATFTGNHAGNAGKADNGNGGAIFEGSGSLTIDGAGSLTFSENKALQGSGGAVYATTDIAIANTGAQVYDNNAATGAGGALHAHEGNVSLSDAAGADLALSFTGNEAGSRGGAIDAEHGSVDIASIEGGVLFSGNSAKGNGGGFDTGNGGAIYAYNDVTISGVTGDVSFLNNAAAVHGGAIFAYNVTLSADGGNIIFDGNTAAGGTRLSAIDTQIDGSTFAFDAAEGREIQFYDPVTGGSELLATVNLNGNGGTGTILFSGAKVADHAGGTLDAEASKYSDIYADTTLEGGTLVLEKGVTYGHVSDNWEQETVSTSFTATAGTIDMDAASTLSAQSISMENTTLDALKGGRLAGASVSFGNGTMKIGRPLTVAATQGLTLQSGAVLSFDMTGGSTTDAQLNITSGTLSLGGDACRITLENYGGLVEDSSYVLIAWAEENDALGDTSFVLDDSLDLSEHSYTLSIDGNRLVLTVGPRAIESDWIWNGSESVWNNTSSGWGIPALADGTPDGKDIYFTEAGVTGDTATVTIDGTVTPASITVTGSKNYVFASGTNGAIGGTSTLTKEGTGTLTLQLANSYTGDTTLKAGTIAVEVEGALGAGTLQVEGSGTLAMKAAVANKASLHDGQTLTLAVAADSATYAGQITGTGNLVKTGSGTLILSAGGKDDSTANTFTGNITVKEGTLELGGIGGGTTTSSGVLGASNSASERLITVETGATLDMHGQKDQNYAVVIAGSGVGGNGALVNMGEAIGLAQITFPKITLADNAGFGGTGDFGIIAASYGITTLDLAGHTLAKTGSNTVTLFNTLIKEGTIDVREGTLAIGSDHGNSSADAAHFLIGAQGRFELNGTTLTIQSLAGSGTVDLGAATGSLTLQTAGTFDGSLTGEGTLHLNGTGEYILGGVIGGAVNVDAAAGNVTLSGANTGTGTLTIGEGKTATIDGSAWAGAVAGNGTLKLVAGTLGTTDNSAQVAASVRVEVDASAGTAGAPNVIQVNGLSGDRLASITLGAESSLKGVSGDITVGGGGNTESLSLTVNRANVGQGAAGTALIEQTGNLVINDGASVSLTVDAVLDLLKQHKQAGNSSYLTLTSGLLDCTDYANITFDRNLGAYGLAISGTNGGSLVVSGQTSDIYDTQDHIGQEGGNVIDNYNELGVFQAVLIQQGHTLSINLDGAPGPDDLDGGVLIRELTAGSGSSLHVVNRGDNADGLNNAVVRLQGGAVAGEIRGDNGVTFTIEGDFTVERTGKLTATDGDVVISGGTLTLQGAGSNIGQLTLDSDEEGDGLTIGGDTTLGTLTDGKGGRVTIGRGATLTLGMGESVLDGATSSIGGAGTLRVEGKLALSGGSRLDGMALDLASKNASVSLGDAAEHAVSALSGSGTLQGVAGSRLTVQTQKGVVSTFDGTLSGPVSVTIAGQGTQAFRGQNIGGGTASLSVQNGAGLQLGLDAAGANSTLSLGSLFLGAGSQTSLTIDTDAWAASTRTNRAAGNAPLISAGSITIEEGVNISLSSLATNAHLNAGKEYTLMTATTGIDGENIVLGADGTLAVNTDGAAFVLIENAFLKQVGNDIVLVTQRRTANLYAQTATTANALAGADLVWNAIEEGLQAGGTLEAVNDALYADLTADPGRANRTLAAVAGSTVASLGMAQKDALRNQMGMIRNRLTDMGVDATLRQEDMPYFHMWAQATGNYSKLSSRGDESGYTLDTWGGTLGLDLDVTEELTLGAAFTAAYGNLDASGAESATGDLDSYYANLFARVQVRRWTHKFIATIATSDAKLNRTVDYGAGSYRARGTTNGLGYGAMYELTYDTWQNEEATAILQPLLNVSFMRTRMDAYTEDGGTAGDAALRVGKQDMTVGTIALGMRLAGELSENALGRVSFGEFRVNVAQDMGDQRSEASVGFMGTPGLARSVRGAKEGRTALQIGAGLTVPIEAQSSIFFDVNADFRAHATSVNGSVGYRYDF